MLNEAYNNENFVNYDFSMGDSFFVLECATKWKLPYTFARSVIYLFRFKDLFYYIIFII